MPAYVYTNFKDKRVSKHLTNTQHLSGFKILQHPKHWNSHMYVCTNLHSYSAYIYVHTHALPPHTPHTHTSPSPCTLLTHSTPPYSLFLLLSWASTALSHTPPPPPAPPHTSPSPYTPTLTVLPPTLTLTLTPLPLPAPPHSQFFPPHPHPHTHTSPSPCTPTLTVLLHPHPHTHSHLSLSLHPHTHSSPSPCTPHTSPSLALQHSLFLHSSLWPPTCHSDRPPLQLQLIHQVEKGVVLTLRDAHRQLLEKDIGKKAWLICTSQGTRGLVPCETYLTVDRIDDIR